MTILAAGSLQNVYASLDAYVTQRIGVDAGIAVRLHGTRRFVSPVDDPWVEVHYDFLGLQSAFRRQTGRYYGNALVLATERQGNIQLNIYQRARLWAQRYTTAVARDAVMDAFPESGIVSIYDYVTAEEQQTTALEVGCLILDGTQEHVQDHGMQSGMIQHVVQVRSRYLEHFTR